MPKLNMPARVALGMALGIFVGLPAVADDTEIYMSQAAKKGAKANVLFILDTSGSMDTLEDTTLTYDPNTTYPSLGCDPDRIYFSTNDTAPTCATANYFPRSSLHCSVAAGTLVNVGPGATGIWPALANSRGRAAQYRTNQWRTLQAGNTGFVECQADDGTHGQNGTTNNRFIRNNANPPWSATSSLTWSGVGSTYRLWTANYLNFRHGPGVPTKQTRLKIVRDAAMALTSSLENVNLGLMRYSSNAQGGYVLQPVADVDLNNHRQNVYDTLAGFDDYEGDGYTPLSETYYESLLYYRGEQWDFGSTSAPDQSNDVAGVMQPLAATRYKSPMTQQCQSNYIVYLTDGAPTRDDNANTKIADKIGKTCAADTGHEPYHDSGWTAGSGMCMDDLAGFMNGDEDGDGVADDDVDIYTGLNGDQTIKTYVIGFGSSLAASESYLNEVARRGGTQKAYTAANSSSLTGVLDDIFSGIQEKSSTFVTPSISVNTFNRAQTSSDLYFSLFKVSTNYHWPGNLKKYTLDRSTIRDAEGRNAVSNDGFFAEGTTSIWSPPGDGNDVTRGGAVSQLPAPAERNIYTNVASNDLNASGNWLVKGNLTDALVGAGADTTTCGGVCENAINWFRGVDNKDVDNDPATLVAKYMGDPLHGRPAVVNYGGDTTSKDDKDVVVFVPTNDGALHAINGRTSGDGEGGGVEMWAFVPKELLGRLHDLHVDESVQSRTYGLDGDVQVLRMDKNLDGVIDPNSGDRVWLFFGMRAGGQHYYGLDVTNRDDPQLLWSIGPGTGASDLPGVGQTWSAPTVARVSVGTNGANNSDDERFVLIFGGGYDPVQESQPYSVDTVGNRIYMVDAETGSRLWFGGGAGTGTPSRTFAKMNNSIPGRVTVIDTDGDLYADRMYAADMGGRVWRFDIWNGQPAASLVTGGVIAQLGAGSNGTQPASANRRFYNAPDVSLVQRRGERSYYNIAIGSGYRGHPLDSTTVEHFYSIRDKQPFARLPQTSYTSFTPILNGDLEDISANPVGSVVDADSIGWKYSFTAAATGRSGEKVLAESTTVNGVVLFPSFQPLDDNPDEPCFPANVNRAYAMFVDTGKPALDFNGDGALDNSDISQTLNQTGIVGDISVAVLRPGEDDGEEEDDEDDPNSPPTACIAGVEVLSRCVAVGGTVRKFWNRGDVE